MPEASRIVVEEFAVPRTVVVERYSGPVDRIGLWYAEILAEELNHMRYEATAVPRGTATSGALTVSGSVAEVDGGSTAKRVLFGFGAGRSEFDVWGKVTDGDGRMLGEFTESRAGGGWGEEDAIEKAMRRTAKLVARMIYTGQYRRNAPKERPAAQAFAAAAVQEPPPAAVPTAEDRLRALERLHADGIVTPEEYAKKRQEILQGL